MSAGLFSVLKQPILNQLMAPGPVLERRLQRRSYVRYKLRLPVIFHWNDGTDHTEGGFTSDVSLDGALILSSICPPIGADVQVELLVPAPGDAAEEIRVKCCGTVTRVMRGGSFGVRGVFNDQHLTRHSWL